MTGLPTTKEPEGKVSYLETSRTTSNSNPAEGKGEEEGKRKFWMGEGVSYSNHNPTAS